jgi:cation:H+ antiporter
MIPYLLLLFGFALLIQGASLLVSGASSIARRWHVSDLVIGLTVVAFGTSSPEMAVTVISSFQGNTDIAIGNVIGSNIANILLILGVASIIFPLSVSRGTIWKEIPFSLLAALVLAVLANDRLIDGDAMSAITRSDGIILLFFFSIFLYYSFSIAQDIEGLPDQVPMKIYSMPGSLLRVVAGLSALTLGGKWIVDGAVDIALALGMSEAVVGLTIVAVGTSLPELATSAVAAYRKNVDIAVGNVVGSNIFNILLVLGVGSLISPLPFDAQSNMGIAMLVFSSLLLFVAMFTMKRRSVDRWEGAVFLACYAAYIVFTVVRG